MNTFKMSPDTLVNLVCDVIDSLEKTLSTSLSSTNAYICDKLQNDLGYSISHIRDAFKLATNISLTKYIKRRKYTIILLHISSKDFNNLSMNAKVFGIQKFKSKCLREFPHIINAHSLEHMQPPIDKTLLHDLLETQIEKREEEYLMKSLYKDIIKGRVPFEINKNSKNIIIQTSNDMLINLEKTYFIYENKVFTITATIKLIQTKIADPFLSMRFGQPVFASSSIPADTNSIVHTLYEFITSDFTTTNGFSLTIEWSDKHNWGSSELISSMTFEKNILTGIKFIDNPFLLFEDKKVLLNLSYFDRAYLK